MDANKLKVVKSLAVGAVAAGVFVVAITIFGELFPTLKGWLKDVHHHHWVGKSIWSAIVFAVVALGSRLVMSESSLHTATTARWVRGLAYVLLTGTLFLFLFFVYEFAMHK